MHDVVFCPGDPSRHLDLRAWLFKWCIHVYQVPPQANDTGMMPRFRQSLFVPILIGSGAIVSTVAILVGWSVLFTKYYTLWTQTLHVPDLGAGYWFTLITGCVFLAGIMTVLVMQLVGNIRNTLYLRQQDTFIDGVTHEFKSPLASIRLCLETMEMRELSPELQARFVGMMKKDVERLIAFVEHILEAGRLEHNQRDITYVSSHIPELIQRCVTIIRDRYNLPSQTFSVGLNLTSSETIYTDPIACETILINLLDNAIKYSSVPAHVNISAQANKGQLVFSISDQGIGIPERLQKKIFQRFYRIRMDGRSDARGTGLGLYVVSSLVKRLGGSIQASSEGVDKGSTFRVTLPLRRPPEENLESERTLEESVHEGDVQ